MNIIPLDSGPFWNLGLESKGEDWKTLQLWIIALSHLARSLRHDASGSSKNQVGVWNWERWSDPEFEELYTKGLAETRPGQAREMYVRMQEIMEDTGAYVWITHEPAILRPQNNIDA